MKTVIMLALCAIGLFGQAKDVAEPNVVSELYGQYAALQTQYNALQKDYKATKNKDEKALIKDQAALVKADADALLLEAKFYGELAKYANIGTYKGIKVPTAEFVEAYKNSTEMAPVVDVYDIKFSIKYPFLSNGIRTFKTSTFAGEMVIEYSDASNSISKAYMYLKNGTTAAIHMVDCTESAYWLIGKAKNNVIARTVPAVYFEGTECEGYPLEINPKYGAHEAFAKLTFAGDGSLAYTKSTVTVAGGGCGACGVPAAPITSTSYCAKLSKMSGFVTGKMNCLCPEDIDWTHTFVAGACGIVDGEISEIRSHTASMAGKFSAVYNKKLSVVNTEE